MGEVYIHPIILVFPFNTGRNIKRRKKYGDQSKTVAGLIFIHKNIIRKK